MKNPRNVIGPRVQQLRQEQGLTQPMLAARCNRYGWNLSRETLAKIELQLRWISDFELICLALALRIEPLELLPGKEFFAKVLKDFFARLSRAPEL